MIDAPADSGTPATPVTDETSLTAPGATPAAAPADPAAAESGAPTAPEGEQPKDTPSKPATPDDYALTFAKDTQVDAALLGGFRQTAHELGLDTVQAQKLAALYEQHVTKIQQQQAEAHRKEFDAWNAQVQSSPAYKADSERVTAALAAFGSKELTEFVETNPMGSYPHLFNFMAAVGKELAEPGFKGKSAGSGDKTAAQILYPDQK